VKCVECIPVTCYSVSKESWPKGPGLGLTLKGADFLQVKKGFAQPVPQHAGLARYAQPVPQHAGLARNLILDNGLTG